MTDSAHARYSYGVLAAIEAVQCDKHNNQPVQGKVNAIKDLEMEDVQQSDTTLQNVVTASTVLSA